MSTLDLALIGNGQIAALVDPRGEIVWACFPRFDGDPVFCSLLREPKAPDDVGFCAVELVDVVKHEQFYLTNTPIVVTRLTDRAGGTIEITDLAPRFRQFGRLFCPMMLVRQVKRISGNPRIRMRMRPAHHYGRGRTDTTTGSNHIRYVGGEMVLRLTTDASITAIAEENPIYLEQAITLILGPDETVQGTPAEVGRRFHEETAAYWREWVSFLAIPYEWQDAVIRAAITLKLNTFEDTGAIVAAVTTSVPEAAGTARNWDYRYCWLRDAYFVVSALNRLSDTPTMERYLGYILNLVGSSPNGRLFPAYGVSGQPVPDEHVADALTGYRGMAPVRIGNAAHRQDQHDVYGATLLAVSHVFFDRRLVQRGDETLFRRLETLGQSASQLYDQPDAGLWELRGKKRVHTFSSVMCWAACDRLARIAAYLGLQDRAAHWQGQAKLIHDFVSAHAWSEKRCSFTAVLDDAETLDASLLRLHEVGFLAADDPRFAGTVQAIERELRRGDFVFRYSEPDDFGAPANAFLVCTFWYINALAALGRRDEARALFENVLACRNGHGLLAEHVDVTSREQWGNFVQTYSMVGIIGSAVRLSLRWDQAF